MSVRNSQPGRGVIARIKSSGYSLRHAMHVRELRLRNFKRFSEIVIDLSSLTTPPKLVLLIGANGCGKSSVFDAFEWLSAPKKDGNYIDLRVDYFSKSGTAEPEARCVFTNGVQVERVSSPSRPLIDSRKMPVLPTAFYGRSSLRMVPELTRRGIQAVDLAANEDRPRLYILPDARFENDLDVVTSRILDKVFGSGDFNAAAIREEFLDPINDALGRIFGADRATSLALTQLKPPLQNQPADIRFRKGTSDIHYDLLSSGEKEVFNIIFNLFSRRDYYRDTIYFIDELDAHLHTALQYNLIREIVEHWIPDSCQLWTASHSLGFIQYAQETAHSAIIDFDELDFDLPRTLLPSPKGDERVFDIVVPKSMALTLFPGKRLILCENKNDNLYNLLGLAETIFIGARDKNAVCIETRATEHFLGLIDRDYLTDDEIAQIRKKLPRLRLLAYYAIENYLYHPDNLSEAIPGFPAEEYRNELIRQKQQTRDKILMALQKTRDGYELIKELERKRKRAGDEHIANALASDELEVFYPYFDMKTKFNRTFLQPYQVSEEQLAQTTWMRTQIAALLP